MDRPTTWTGISAAAVFCLASVGCGPPENAEDANAIEMGEEAVSETAESQLNAIDTTAEAVWEHLQDVSYAGNWDTWPGTEPFYEGREPHGMLLTTYVNDAGREGIEPMREGAQDEMPLGSVIVKENYQPDSTLASTTVMYKAEGYDPEHGDWFWMKRLADGTVDASGHVGSCIDCHAEGTDYLMADLEASHAEM